MAEDIEFWNRKKKIKEKELVYGDALMRFAYENPMGRFLSEHSLSKPWLSRLVGNYHDTQFSSRKIPSFIEKFKIPMEEYESSSYSTFNEFFIRKFKPGMRPFDKEPSRMGAFAEGRYLCFDQVTPEMSFPVKGKELSASALLDSEKWAKVFEGGPLIIARLCPVDYHRFHYPDDGTTVEKYRVSGQYHSVNPAALKVKDDVFSKNERVVSILETKNFGTLAYIEVGAMCVGKIVLTQPDDLPFYKGDEKGYFLFGGSTVILMGVPGKWTIDSDLLEWTQKKTEVFVQLGEGIASA
ncbi:MAG: phosphatidylserine decarboxylase [Bdellovibrionaceae bacterium]|nr:phosphatidylserine decarboxylase [Pseudobdellovibrionaceae bacterium]